MQDHDTEMIADHLRHTLHLLYAVPPPPLPQRLADLMARLKQQSALSHLKNA